MALVNIGASNASDQFYRYKMPAVVSRIEGRGNGIKTNVVNLVDVAKALARPPTYVLKWFGFELGALTKYEEKDGKCIVNGAHDAKVLAEHLEVFIKKFVQCFSCGNPETVFSIDKRTELITRRKRRRKSPREMTTTATSSGRQIPPRLLQKLERKNSSRVTLLKWLRCPRN
jgi:translation initiation factor 5